MVFFLSLQLFSLGVLANKIHSFSPGTIKDSTAVLKLGLAETMWRARGRGKAEPVPRQGKN